MTLTRRGVLTGVAGLGAAAVLARPSAAGAARPRPAAGPRQLWQATLSRGASRLTTAGPALLPDSLTMADQGAVRCYDLHSGAVRWERRVAADPAGLRIGAAGGAVVAAWPAHPGGDGAVQALSAADGAVLWSHAEPAVQDLVAGGDLFAVGTRAAGRAPGAVLLRRAATGELVCRIDGAGLLLAAWREHGLVLVSEGGSPVGGPCVAYDVASGAPRWRIPAQAALLTDAGRRFLRTGRGYEDQRCYDLATGRELWSARGRGGVYAAAGAGVFVDVGFDDVRGHDARTGALRWEVRVREQARKTLWRPQFLGDRLLLVGSHHLVELDPASGAERWRALFRGAQAPVHGSPAVFAHCWEDDLSVHALD